MGSSNFSFKMWQHENRPILLNSEVMCNQRLHYLHRNPVTVGFVIEPWHWKRGSAVNYMTDKNGLLDLVMLD